MLKCALRFPCLKVVARLTISFHFLALGSKSLMSHDVAACHMMVARVQQMVSDSFGQLSYEKATDCLRALRAECLKVTHRTRTH